MKQHNLDPTFFHENNDDWMNWCLAYRDKVYRGNVMWALEQNDRPLAELLIAEYNDQPWATCFFLITNDGHIKWFSRRIEDRVRALENLSQAQSEDEKDQIIKQFNQRQLGEKLERVNGQISVIEGLPVPGNLIRKPDEPVTPELQERRDNALERGLWMFLKEGNEGVKKFLASQRAQFLAEHPESDKQIPQSNSR